MILAGCLGVALAVHVLLFSCMPTFASLRAQSSPHEVDMEFVTPAPTPAPPPTPTPEIPPEPEPEAVVPQPRRARRTRPVVTPPEETPEETPAPAEEVPLRMDGVTLTSAGAGPGFAVDPGSGEDRQGPLGPPGQATGRRVHGRADGTPGGTGGRGPRVVALADLSQRPRPPNLERTLHREYPSRARRQGVEGVAIVRALVEPNGNVRRFRGATTSVEGYGFIEACERVLRGSRWTPPLDRQGRSVAVWIRYRCGFSVRH